jgi:rare lipoprotein A
MAATAVTMALQGCTLLASGPESPAPGDGASIPLSRGPVSAVPDAVPKAEVKTRSGNPESYEIDGEEYRVMDTSEGYRETAVASWYGQAFQGRRTSSGEPYDMYQMTAAHKTLPIPTYVRVTNLENGRSVVVRVNDRGPFIAGRIIDLSLVAAQKLDMVRDGTARVEVVALDPPASDPGS